MANLATFLMADEVEFVTGQVIAIDGGQHLNNTGTFNCLESLSDEDWRLIRESIKEANQRDKELRG